MNDATKRHFVIFKKRPQSFAKKLPQSFADDTVEGKHARWSMKDHAYNIPGIPIQPGASRAEVDRWALAEARRLSLSIIKSEAASIYLFGSRATGNPRRFSDIDLAIDWNGRPVPSAVMTRLVTALEESCIPYSVDIVDMQSADEKLRKRILSEGVKWSD